MPYDLMMFLIYVFYLEFVVILALPFVLIAKKKIKAGLVILFSLVALLLATAMMGGEREVFSLISFAVKIGFIALLIGSIVLLIKKKIKMGFIILGILVTCLSASIMMAYSDIHDVENDMKPKYSLITSVLSDGGSTTYVGLGYDIHKHHWLWDQEINGERQIGYMKGYAFEFMFIPVSDCKKFVPNEN